MPPGIRPVETTEHMRGPHQPNQNAQILSTSNSSAMSGNSYPVSPQGGTYNGPVYQV